MSIEQPAKFACIGRSSTGERCGKKSTKGICSLRGACWNGLNTCFQKLYPKILAADSPWLEVTTIFHIESSNITYVHCWSLEAWTITVCLPVQFWPMLAISRGSYRSDLRFLIEVLTALNTAYRLLEMSDWMWRPLTLLTDIKLIDSCFRISLRVIESRLSYKRCSHLDLQVYEKEDALYAQLRSGEESVTQGEAMMKTLAVQSHKYVHKPSVKKNADVLGETVAAMARTYDRFVLPLEQHCPQCAEPASVANNGFCKEHSARGLAGEYLVRKASDDYLKLYIQRKLTQICLHKVDGDLLLSCNREDIQFYKVMICFLMPFQIWKALSCSLLLRSTKDGRSRGTLQVGSPRVWKR